VLFSIRQELPICINNASPEFFLFWGGFSLFAGHFGILATRWHSGCIHQSVKMQEVCPYHRIAVDPVVHQLIVSSCGMRGEIRQSISLCMQLFSGEIL